MWFTDENFKPLDREDKVNITLVIKSGVIQKMRCYSVQPLHQIFVKSYAFLSFSQNTGKVIAKNIIENLSAKYRRNFLATLHNLQEISLKQPQKNKFKNLLKKLLI